MITRAALVAICWLSACPDVGAQEPAQGAPARDPKALWAIPADLSLVAMMDKTQWHLTVLSPDPKYRARTAEEVEQDLNAYAAAPGDEELRVLVKKHQVELARLIRSFSLVGTELGRFVYLTKTVPTLIMRKSNDLALIVSGVASSKTYNTLQLNVNQRAVAALRSMILPSLKAFGEMKEASGDFKYYGLSVVYGSKDFLDKSALALKPESLTVVVSAEQCAKFVAGELTEDDLVAGADVYISDRDMITGIRKVRLSLQ